MIPLLGARTSPSAMSAKREQFSANPERAPLAVRTRTSASQLFGAHFAGTIGVGVGLSPQSDKPPHEDDCGWLANNWPTNWTCVGRPDDSQVSPNHTKVGHCGHCGTLSMVILQKETPEQSVVLLITAKKGPLVWWQNMGSMIRPSKFVNLKVFTSALID